MKRLLAYLFVVLGLGLIFNINANAKIIYCVNKILPNITEKDYLELKKSTFSSSHLMAQLFSVNDTKTQFSNNMFECGPEKDKRFKIVSSNDYNKLLSNFRKFALKVENKKTQIAKAEPSQTEKISKNNDWRKNLAVEGTATEKNKDILCLIKRIKNDTYSYFYVDESEIYKLNNSKYNWQKILGPTNVKYPLTTQEKKELKFCDFKIYKSKNYDSYFALKKLWENTGGFKGPNFISIKTLSKFVDKNLYAEITNDNNTQIAKAEPTVTPKKKVKAAKAEEPKQEEFKPENKDIDNDAPIIEIAQNITVSDTSYVIEGKVSDKSDKIFVEIDGQPVEVRKGKFKAKRYSPVDEQVKIVAIDQWGNKSKPKIVNIKINIEETVVAENLEPLNPSNIRTKSSNEKIAIIIGIENYSEAPKANYANLDAQYFFDYARKAFGVKKQNINLLINENATVVKTDKALSLWLKSKIKKNRSDLIIFFAGHGLASTDGKELYLLPQDGNPDRLERTALSRTDLFREIIELNPKNVTMFLDTCYSGVSRDEQMLLASARPIRIVADEKDGIPDNFTIFSASKLDQISSGLKEAKHGIFSYYLMKGLEGYADFNEDKKITNGELLAYMDENVSQKAAEQGREQNPSLAGDPDKVLISYR